MARWWALFNVGGPEIDLFGRYVEAGQPALDVACGTGRLLVPWVRAGYDVDGADVSPDMIAHCRQAVGAVTSAGRRPDLRAQAIHELDLPRRYRTAVICGGFGLGTTPDEDAEGLRRIHDHLEPGGVLVMDDEQSGSDPADWQRWRDRAAAEPVAVPEPAARRRGPDGDDYALVHRFVSVDAEARRGVREIRAWRWHHDELIAEERYELTFTSYRPAGLVALLDAAGFVDVRVLGGYDGGPPTPEHRFLVFEAHTG